MRIEATPDTSGRFGENEIDHERMERQTLTQNGKSETASSSPDIDEVKADITALTRDLAALIDKMRIVAADSSSEAIRDSVEALGGQAGILYEKVTSTGSNAAKAVGRQIEAKPVLSLLIAFSIGFCASRFFSR